MNRELATWTFSWSSLNYRVGQKVKKFGLFQNPPADFLLSRPNAAEYCNSEKKLVKHRWLFYTCARFGELWQWRRQEFFSRGARSLSPPFPFLPPFPSPPLPFPSLPLLFPFLPFPSPQNEEADRSSAPPLPSPPLLSPPLPSCPLPFPPLRSRPLKSSWGVWGALPRPPSWI